MTNDSHFYSCLMKNGIRQNESQEGNASKNESVRRKIEEES